MAHEVMTQTPGIMEVLSPEKQRELQGRVTAFQQAEVKATMDAKKKYLELKATLGREPTPVERARYASVAPPQRERTVSDKIAATEAALGRPPSPAERERSVGLEPPDKPSWTLVV